MRIIQLAAVTAALVGGVMLSGPAIARAQPATGGCYGGSVLSSYPTPGTIHITGTMSSCGSPLLPGITGGLLTITYPQGLGGLFGVPNPQASGNVAWSNGQSSAISGIYVPIGSATSTFAITAGPGVGHHLLVTVTEGRRGTDHLVTVLLAP